MTDAGELHAPKRRSIGRGLGEWLGILVAALLAAFLIRTYVVQTFYIPSRSMEDTLLINDRVLVNKLSYKFEDVKRGDVVVFERPPLETNTQIKDLIKRVVGLPGDQLESRDGRLYVNGVQLPEPYLRPGAFSSGLSLTTVAPDHYFVMGDNRTDSEDSRVFGAISEDLIVGKASVRIWPFSRFDKL